MKNEIMKWTKKWWNEQLNNETLAWLSNSVKHTKWPSALAYDEMNNNVKLGELLWIEKCANVNECGDNMMWG